MSGEKTRLAFAFGHLGDSFHGSQVQPDLRTVQGRLQDVLADLGFISRPLSNPQPLALASRTDAGVHVRMNVAAFDIDSQFWDGMQESGFINAMNDQLEGDLVVWAATMKEKNWNPRRAESRTYRYRLDALEDWQDVPAERLQEWLNIFVGKHDFKNFSRTDDVPDTIREILSTRPLTDKDGRIIGFEITGRAFLWNMVRRIASALVGLAKGSLQEAQVRKALDEPQIKQDLGLVSADWLILWEVEHPNSHLLNRSRLVDASKKANIPPNKNLNRRAFQRWVEVARLEQKLLCHEQWDAIIRAP